MLLMNIFQYSRICAARITFGNAYTKRQRDSGTGMQLSKRAQRERERETVHIKDHHMKSNEMYIFHIFPNY